MDLTRGTKRPRSRSRSPSSRPRANHREVNRGEMASVHVREQQIGFNRRQLKKNEAQEDAQMKEWVSKEDDFVLKQARKKARIRVREGRAKPIDWLAVILSMVDKEKDLLEDDLDDSELEVIAPETLVEGLGQTELKELSKDVDHYLTLEKGLQNRTYWKAVKVIIDDQNTSGSYSRGASAVSADISWLLQSKSIEQLCILKDQVQQKLRSNESIDEDYWEHLLDRISKFEAKTRLREVYDSIRKSRLKALKVQQVLEADSVVDTVSDLVHAPGAILRLFQSRLGTKIDRQPILRLPSEYNALDSVEEKNFVQDNVIERENLSKTDHILNQRKANMQANRAHHRPIVAPKLSGNRFADLPHEDFSHATKALYEREVARGVQENEEIFTGEEEVLTLSKSQWVNKYRPRKPRYFNRVQMGYEWNKYNQTHYDHDNPPPKVVQGYKFNVFYPDLIDKTKAPTYRVERENGRKKGQSFAPAGEEDTCLIRFMSGPPYEDLAFRIVDKEWDYSAKRERGFRSSFEKGILQLHFQFKKVFYRK